MKRYKQLLEDYYAALAWLHLDFAAGVDDNLAYMNTLVERVGELELTDDELDRLDMAWSISEKLNDYWDFDMALYHIEYIVSYRNHLKGTA